jgi:hypothetical protein
MMREMTRTCIPKRTAHAMRAAAIRLARERAAEEADPTATYGCVDWYQYDVPLPPRTTAEEQSAAAVLYGTGRDTARSTHC